MDNEKNPREELYQRFKESLTHPVGDRFFDEDELVDIYDFAGDLDDDYVQLEVLLCGARLYPESEALTERKVLLYLDTTDETTDERTMAASNFLADNPEASSIIFDIARLEVASPENPREALSFLLNQYQRFDDEEVIRFIQLALDLDCYSWIIENLDEFKNKVDYLPTLYYELAREADEISDDANLVKFADALIEIEPFAPQYWMMLLRGQARLGDKEAATQTFDYAMALAGDSRDAILALTEICFNYAEYLLPQLIEALKRLLDDYPDDFRVVDCYCAANSKLNRVNDILKALRDYATLHPENPLSLHRLINYGTDDAVSYMERYFAVCGAEGLSALRPDVVIPDMANHGNKREVIAYIDILEKLSPSDYSHNFNTIIEFYFQCRKYEKVVEIAEKHNKEFMQFLEEHVIGCVMAYVYCFSLVKIGRYKDAVEFAHKHRLDFEDRMKTSFLAARMVIRSLLNLFDNLDNHPDADELYWEYYDPLRNEKF